MKQILEMETGSGEIKKMELWVSCYVDNKSLYLGLDSADGFWKPYCDVTVNFSGEMPSYCAFVDVCKVPGLERFLAAHKIGRPAGVTKRSGHNEYPLYQFDPERLRGLHPDGVLTYEQENRAATKKAGREETGERGRKGR